MSSNDLIACGPEDFRKWNYSILVFTLNIKTIISNSLAPSRRILEWLSGVSDPRLINNRTTVISKSLDKFSIKYQNSQIRAC